MRVVSYWPESDRSVGIHAVLSPSLALYRIPRSLLNAFLVPFATLVRPTSSKHLRYAADHSLNTLL